MSGGYSQAGHDDFVTGRMVALARESRVWTLVLSVLMFFLAALTGLGIVLEEVAAQEQDDVALPLLIGQLIAVAINYGLPAVLMFLVSQQLGLLVQQPHTAHLLSVLRAQRVYWTTLGVLSLFWLVGLILAVFLWVLHADREIEWFRAMTQ